MSLMDTITLPEVTPRLQSAKFIRRGNQTLIEISMVGSKDTNVEKVRPDHMARFKSEWDAFCDGRPPERRPGTPLTELSSIDDAKAEHYIFRNVHSLEELAALDDGQCQSLGHGTLTDRQAARALVARKQAEQRDAMHKKAVEATAKIGPVPAEKYAGNSEVEALKSDVAEMKTAMASIAASLAELAARKKPGRPPKTDKGAE